MVGQIVAAVAGGALLGIAAVFMIKVRTIERRAERQERVDTAVRAVLSGVESFRQDSLDRALEHGSRPGQTTGSAVEVRAKAHLRLMVDRPQHKAPGRGGARSSRRARSASVSRA
ncbi:hypothetical protein JHN59_37505 [Streptomyces sp. MBT49]|uniref:hypothetical protein n=1 Tax=Streptomyces sp. MBT49 TaxID=1488380 RepID=UPI00190DFD95|nr:hypothetical protein [Streptomyces sp. MBT49]MBK3630399.1 hypothetical protein [Streptomyces sp. MBT49]